jgi:hypothetical protein
MSKKAHGMTVAKAISIALGFVPAVSLALDGGNAASPARPLCSTVTGEASFTVPLDAQPSVVKGAPYSGVGTTEVVNTLQDGNRITRTNTTRYYRDSAGRLRTEYQLSAVGPFELAEAQSIVTITDPIAGRRYVLHPSMKRADIFKLAANGSVASTTPGNAIFLGSARGGVPGVGVGVGSPGVGVGVGGQPRSGLMPSTQGSPRRGFSLPSPRGNDRTPKMMAPGLQSNDTRLSAVEPMGAAPGEAAGAPGYDVLLSQPGAGIPACNVAAMKAAKPVSIGERSVEGLKVRGSRLEFTIAPGEVGNEQPITVRTDQWFSPDLGVVVSSTHHDPMMGETTYRLEQIDRVEPEESLFVVPEEYAKNPVGF